MKLLTGIALVCASLAATTYAFADRGKLDTDGNGSLSLTEIQVARPGLTADKFALMDSNGDGVLSRDEEPRGRRRGPSMDTNGDGSVDLNEFQAARPNMTADKFAEIDTNNDGLLSREERPRRKDHKGRSERFAALDTDGSGGVSLGEMQAAKSAKLGEQFARMDTDGNGEVSLEEHQARAKKRHGHRKNQRMNQLEDDSRTQ